MWTNSERYWLRLRPCLGFAALQGLLLALAAMLAPALRGPWAQDARALAAPAPLAAVAAFAPAAHPVMPPVPPSELDGLRADASLGDPDAAGLLVSQLLDRYEQTGDTDSLHEAVQWIDRGWDTGRYQQSGLATRVFERYCGDRVLRWHWLCDEGE